MSETAAVATAHARGRALGPRLVDVFGSTVALWNVALAAPLLDLLGRNAEFFVAHRASRWTVALLALALCLGMPLLLAVVTTGLLRWHAPLGRLWHAAVVAVLSTTFSLVVLNRFDVAVSGWMTMGLAFMLGVIAGIVYLAFPLVRSFVNFAAPAPLVVLAVFVFLSPASSIVLAGETTIRETVLINEPSPVTLVVFDEFPIASIMDATGGIDESLFPNFARLAEASTWYRNAVTVDSHTRWAVPAILSGTRPSRETLPVAADHPRTLFTALGAGNPRYQPNVHETMTQVCPSSLCVDQESRARMGMSLIGDLRVVVGHILLPSRWRDSLPPVDNAWAGFRAGAEGEDAADFEWDRDAILRGHDKDFRSFIRSIDASRRSLNFFHALLPHGPWRYLPTGVEYQTVTVPGRKLPLWGDDEWLISQAYQRHLMQVAFVDKLVGELMAHLRAEGIFDDTLLILVADHGVAFQPNKLVRGVERANLGELAAVPLFIKEPGQTDGRVDDRPAETTDILPTVFDALGVSSAWELEGRSLLGDWEERDEHLITHGDDETLRYPADGQNRREFARRKYEIYQAEQGDLDLFRLGPGPTRQLIGKMIDEVDLHPQPSPHSVLLEDPALYSELHADQRPFPALVSGRVNREDETTRLSVVAIAVNGRIEAVTRTYNKPRVHGIFSAIVRPEVLLENSIDFEFYEVVGTGTGLVLRRLQSGTDY